MAPYFDMPGVDGNDYSSAKFSDTEVLLVAFRCNHCPYIVGSEDRIVRLKVAHGLKGVAMIAIKPNEIENRPPGPFEHVINRVRDKGSAFS